MEPASFYEMNRDELLALRKRLVSEIENREKLQKSNAIKALKEVAQEHGFKLSELVGDKAEGNAKPSRHR
ncbi:H-NS family nucleoid-associated regulatory protein [Paracoccus alkanivorans]|nr:H-NS family nucleoid-associated regulatory protein [Paracoccus alkanivorans]